MPNSGYNHFSGEDSTGRTNAQIVELLYHINNINEILAKSVREKKKKHAERPLPKKPDSGWPIVCSVCYESGGEEDGLIRCSKDKSVTIEAVKLHIASAGHQDRCSAAKQKQYLKCTACNCRFPLRPTCTKDIEEHISRPRHLHNYCKAKIVHSYDAVDAARTNVQLSHDGMAEIAYSFSCLKEKLSLLYSKSLRGGVRTRCLSKNKRLPVCRRPPPMCEVLSPTLVEQTKLIEALKSNVFSSSPMRLSIRLPNLTVILEIPGNMDHIHCLICSCPITLPTTNYPGWDFKLREKLKVHLEREWHSRQFAMSPRAFKFLECSVCSRCFPVSYYYAETISTVVTHIAQCQKGAATIQDASSGENDENPGAELPGNVQDASSGENDENPGAELPGNVQDASSGENDENPGSELPGNVQDASSGKNDENPGAELPGNTDHIHCIICSSPITTKPCSEFELREKFKVHFESEWHSMLFAMSPLAFKFLECSVCSHYFPVFYLAGYHFEQAISNVITHIARCWNGAKTVPDVSSGESGEEHSEVPRAPTMCMRLGSPAPGGQTKLTKSFESNASCSLSPFELDVVYPAIPSQKLNPRLLMDYMLCHICSCNISLPTIKHAGWECRLKDNLKTHLEGRWHREKFVGAPVYSKILECGICNSIYFTLIYKTRSDSKKTMSNIVAHIEKCRNDRKTVCSGETVDSLEEVIRQPHASSSPASSLAPATSDNELVVGPPSPANTVQQTKTNECLELNVSCSPSPEKLPVHPESSTLRFTEDRMRCHICSCYFSVSTCIPREPGWEFRLQEQLENHLKGRKHSRRLICAPVHAKHFECCACNTFFSSLPFKIRHNRWKTIVFKIIAHIGECQTGPKTVRYVNSGESTETSEEVNSGESTETSKEVNSGESTEMSEEVNSGESTETSEEVNSGESTETSEEVNSGESTVTSEEVNSGESTETSEEVNSGESNETSEEVNSGESTETSEDVNSGESTETSEEVTDRQHLSPPVTSAPPTMCMLS